MNAFSHSLAATLIGWCVALLPSDRASWAAAMKAEVDAIENGNAALSFAAGCVWGSIKERTFTMAFAARSVRFATIAGMLALSFLGAVITRRMIDAHAPSAMVFGLTSALFAAAAGWSYLRGPMALVQTACSLISLYILAYVFVSHEIGMAGGWGDGRLYQALAIEGVVIWAALLAGGIFMLRVEALSTIKRS
jgi:hypothetical protein